ncbi:MAG: CDP-glucose 4,6-dehydratase [Pseudomonadota bacterium]
MDALASTYRDRRVLVTGHTGFKGGWLVAWLARLGARTVGFALPPESEFFAEAEIERDCVSVIGDVRDSDGVAALFAQVRPEVVFHLAGQSLVGRSYEQPQATFAINLLGTVNVLEAARHTPSVAAVVVATSDKVYDNRNPSRAHREDDPLGGADPYSASKACAELATHAYRSSFFAAAGSAAVASARSGNVIGGGDWSHHRLVPDFVRAIAGGQSLVLRRPQATRPWQHVLDPLHGYLLLGKSLVDQGRAFAEGWNFGPPPDDAITVRDLAQRLVRRWGTGLIEERPESASFHEQTLLRLDTAKARDRLGWQPLLSLDDGVALTCDWYQACLADRASARAILLRQIDAFAAVLYAR